MVRADSRAKTTAAALGLAAVLVVVGCSSEVPNYPVHGRIVYKQGSRPYTQGGWVWLECTKPPCNRLAAQLTGSGEFTIPVARECCDSMPGDHRVCLQAGDLGATRAGMAAYMKNLDKKYVAYATSGLTVTVVPNQDNDFTLYVTKSGDR
jgi:hypothetical protein